MNSLSDEEKIKKAFANKKWPEIQSTNSWMVFKVMAEFVNGLESMARIGPCVSVFGSARTLPEHPAYHLASDSAFK